MIQPSHLKQGDLIGMVCPAGAIPIERVQTCVQTLEAWGYKVAIGKTVGGKHYTFSGTDAQRAEDLQIMLDNPEVKAIICARGGYGLSKIIDQINFTKFIAQPKWVIGFSDITVLHAAIHQLGIASIHGPMAAAFNKGVEGEPYIQSIKDVLEGRPTHFEVGPHDSNQIGVATAPLVGGNLCLIAHLIGSKYSLDTKDKILFLEDTTEHHYNLDRMLIQLKNAGLLSNIKGLIVGGFTSLKDEWTDIGQDIVSMVQSYVTDKTIPIAFDFPISHELPNYAVKEGVEYYFEVTEKGVLLKEGTIF
ncbi:MAG: S66 peptidase family protein [Sediminibacterium sp.]|jgi:muramoyltetrapeptide carboxypeptidase